MAIRALLLQEPKMLNIMRRDVPMIISPSDAAAFSVAAYCYLCNKIATDDNRLVRDHCHMSGEYLGAAHNICNLNRRDKHAKIPVFAHNMMGFDASFLINAMEEELIGQTISCIGG